jgi:hypothetical protein
MLSTSVEIIDDGGAGYSSVGSWLYSSGQGYGGDVRYSALGTGNDVARWTFNVTPGQYRVSASWFAHSNRASNAPYTIQDGNSVLATVRVSQKVAANDVSDAGTNWEYLGGPYNITSNTLVVTLSDAANGYVIADAVRVEPYVVPPIQIIDNGDAGFSKAGNWPFSSGQGYGGDVHYSALGSGSDVARWTFAVTPGRYRVSASWFAHANRASNAPYTIFNGSTVLATVRVSQKVAANDFSDAGVSWEDLGGPYDITGNTLVVELSDAANGYVIADAVRIEAQDTTYYIAQNATGGNTGSSCANARSAAWFNTPANWGTGAGQIGPGTTVHLCGTLTGIANGNVLQFKGSGAQGNPVTLLFETGAVVQAPYCSSTGCIDLNGQSHITIDGGTDCGKLSGGMGPTTPCNGTIRNTLAGSSGQACPGGACAYQLPDWVGASSLIYSGGNPTDIEIRNLTLGPVYVRSTTTNMEGMATTGIVFNYGLPQNIRVHNNVMFSGGKLILVNWPDNITGNQSAFYFYGNSMTDQCWAIGMGVNTSGSAGSTITDIQIHDNEISNWTNWAPDVNSRHGNGTMLFNYNSAGTGTIGDSGSNIYNNYLYGDLTGGLLASSPSGFLSCQDNCVNVNFFNNRVVDTCTGQNPSRSCGTPIYFNGPGGGGQVVVNNTLEKSNAGAFIAMIGATAPVTVKNNVFSNGSYPMYVLPNSYPVVSDYNDAYNFRDWICTNTAAGPPTCLTLAQVQAQHGQDTHSSSGNPNLDANGKLQAGSAAIGLGTNLTSLGITGLNTDAGGNPRPAVGAWDAGAFQLGGIPPA